jgi:hypothetical protein
MSTTTDTPRTGQEWDNLQKSLSGYASSFKYRDLASGMLRHSKILERELTAMENLARELRDALGVSLRQWCGNAEANGEDRDLDNEISLEAELYRSTQSILTKAKEVLG